MVWNALNATECKANLGFSIIKTYSWELVIFNECETMANLTSLRIWLTITKKPLCKKFKWTALSLSVKYITKNIYVIKNIFNTESK